MKIYKDKQFLVFDFEDGKAVKYDFATKKCVGKSGKEVQSLNSQLRGLTIDGLCNNCTDKQYGKFLRFVQKHGDFNGVGISNIGTILNRVPYFSQFEQIFSAGIENVVDENFRYSINDIPKALIKLCKERHITLSNNFLEFYKNNPDSYLLAYKLDYVSLDDNDIYQILAYEKSVKEYYGNQLYQYTWRAKAIFNNLIDDFGYTAKALMLYLDYCKTYEAFDSMTSLLGELYDYAVMMKEISPKFEKYPRHFLTTHKIATRNYNRLKKQFEEEKFKSRIDKEMEKNFGEYCFIYPECTQDIKDEAAQQSNCVASYIQKVIDGQCHILFLRRKESPDKSLVTIEVRNGRIVQASQRFNHPLTTEQKEVVDKWNTWYSKKMKENESEELKNVG